jgi:hypothetical protein
MVRRNSVNFRTIKSQRHNTQLYYSEVKNYINLTFYEIYVDFFTTIVTVVVKIRSL